MKKNYAFLAILLFLTANMGFAQTKAEKEKIIQSTNVVALEKFAVQAEGKSKVQKAEAIKMAKEKGWPITKTEDGSFLSLMKVINGNPIYYTTFNVDAAVSTRTNFLHNMIVQELKPGEIEVASIDPFASMQVIDNDELSIIAKQVRENLENVVNALSVTAESYSASCLYFV